MHLHWRYSSIASSLVLFATVAFAAQGGDQFSEALVKDETLLHEYTFKQRTEVKHKGQVKFTRVDQITFDAEGRRHSAPMDEEKTTSGHLPIGPIRRAKAKKKQDEMRDYVKRLGELIEQYVPLDRQKLRASFSTKEDDSAKDTKLIFENYFKAGDSVVLLLDRNAHQLVSVDVATKLDGDPVTVSAEMASAPNGARYPGQMHIKSQSRDLEVDRTQYDFRKP